MTEHPYRSVIVGTDGSETAQRAVRVAAGLAERLGVGLVVASAYERTTTADLGPASERAEMPGDAQLASGYRGASERVQDASTEARRIASDVEVEPTAVDGEAAEELLTLAERRQDPLLVVGNQGMTGSRRFLLGSVPNKVSHHAPCDVLIVRTGGGRTDDVPRTVLAATDGSATATRALERAIALVAALGAELTVLAVSSDRASAEDVVAAAAERAAAAGVETSTLVESGDAADRIVARSADVDLVVVGSRGMSGAGRFLLGSVPNKVSHHVDSDLLIVKTD